MKQVQAVVTTHDQLSTESLAEPNPPITASVKKPKGEPLAQQVRQLLMISEVTWDEMRVFVPNSKSHNIAVSVLTLFPSSIFRHM